ncbi:MAG: hypothetical protein ACRYG8_34205 [Janthinobacterium lividum]
MRAISNPADIAKMIEHSQVMGCGYLAHLLRPVLAGNINLLMPLRDTVMPPLYRMQKAGKPVVALLGDDDYQPAGPDTWACAAKLRNWATFAIVHGTGAQDQHYQAAAALTYVHKRLLMIETTSTAAHLWAGFLKQRADLPFMGFLPSEGSYPIMPPREGLH